MEATARPAEPVDLDVVVVLAEAAIAELRDQRGGDVWWRAEARSQPVRPALAAALDDADQHLVVGTIDDTVVAYACLRTRDLHDGAVLADLSDLYVLPGAREVGVGEAMMDRAVAWATARGCVGIDSIALPGDRATKNFFESFGLKARAIRVHRRLDDR